MRLLFCRQISTESATKTERATEYKNSYSKCVYPLSLSPSEVKRTDRKTQSTDKRRCGLVRMLCARGACRRQEQKNQAGAKLLYNMRRPFDTQSRREKQTNQTGINDYSTHEMVVIQHNRAPYTTPLGVSGALYYKQMWSMYEKVTRLCIGCGGLRVPANAWAIFRALDSARCFVLNSASYGVMLVFST